MSKFNFKVQESVYFKPNEDSEYHLGRIIFRGSSEAFLDSPLSEDETVLCIVKGTMDLTGRITKPSLEDWCVIELDSPVRAFKYGDRLTSRYVIDYPSADLIPATGTALAIYS